MRSERYILSVKTKFLNLCSRYKKQGFESNDGFLLVDGLLSLVILGIIVSIVMPTIINVKILNHDSSEKLNFYRDLFIEMKQGNDWKTSNKYIVTEEKICNQLKTICINTK